MDFMDLGEVARRLLAGGWLSVARRALGPRGVVAPMAGFRE
jgi:hypothetical protein